VVPVWETGRTGQKGYSIENFEHSFYEICESHQREGRALLFAFLLAGETAPQIAKVLAIIASFLPAVVSARFVDAMKRLVSIFQCSSSTFTRSRLYPNPLTHIPSCLCWSLRQWPTG
jgi:hypothetical protein